MSKLDAKIPEGSATVPIPNIIIMTPSDENETRQLLFTGYQFNGPAAIRYPRGVGTGKLINKNMESLPIGCGVIKNEGSRVAILNFGTLLPAALHVGKSNNFTVADMRFVKPIDEGLIDALCSSHELIVTIEENSIKGGAGSAVGEYLNEVGNSIPLLQLGLPDKFINHGSRDKQIADCGLNEGSIQKEIFQRLQKLNKDIKEVKINEVDN